MRLSPTSPIASAAIAAAVGLPTVRAAPSDDLEPRPRVQPVFHADGSIDHGGEHYPSAAAFTASTAFAAEGRRCASEPPDEETVRVLSRTDCDGLSTVISEAYEGGAFVIPVVFHVVRRSDGLGHIPRERIESQIDVLNEDFNALPGSLGEDGARVRIAFRLADVDPDGQPHGGVEYVTDDELFADPNPFVGLRTRLAWDTRRYLNIYTSAADGLLGQASFPFTSSGAPDDGVVLFHASVGRNAPDGGNFDLGRTATHEIGHYFGLMHTFRGGCGVASSSPYVSGDLVADTAAHGEANFECRPAAGCGDEPAPIENYMNYSHDACMSRFTEEQANRMRCSLINYRRTLYRIDAEPRAMFDAEVDRRTVRFVDLSEDAEDDIVDWSWDFGDGGASNEPSPQHQFVEAGTYSVVLTVTDRAGSRSSFASPVYAGDGAALGLPGTRGEGGFGLAGCSAAGGASGATGLALLSLLQFVRRRRR